MDKKLNDKLVLPELSYQIVGVAFKVFNTLGWGFSEKYYQRALVKEFSDLGMNFKREVLIPLKYSDSTIGRYFVDFVVEDKILIEVKIISKLGYAHVGQVLGYLRNSGIKLGILLYFTKDGIKYRRVLNPDV